MIDDQLKASIGAQEIKQSFVAHRFRIVIGDSSITNSVKKMSTVFQQGIATLEIHVRDSQSATLPQEMFALTTKGAVADIRLQQLDEGGETLRNTLFANCTISHVTHHNLDYGNADTCEWIIKAVAHTVVSTGVA